MRWLCAALLISWVARAETRTYVLAVGNNRPPPGSELEPLRYADDDAAGFYVFARELSHSAILLTVLDVDSQRRFPDVAAAARPPSLVELKQAVATLRGKFEADVRDGHEPVLLFFYGGHGTRGGQGQGHGITPPSLTLIDAPLTQAVLYDEVLAALPARYVHLLIDACHAEAVVRPRDVSAQPVDITDEDVQAYAARATLDRFPQVGAVLATASGVQAHEWDVYQRGVFSHQLVSALRGAADVNHDGKIEYSELAAFLGAANRDVSDPRARLSVVVRPPSLNRRAPLVETAQLRNSFALVGRGVVGEVFVEDELGNRIADFHAEPGHRVSLALPSERPLFVRQRSGEARVRAAAGTVVSLDGMRFAAQSVKPRGAIETSLQRGLFATAYGPRYYRGYVDQNQELTPVPITDEKIEKIVRDPPTPSPADGRRAGIALLGVAGGLAAGAVILGGLAGDALSQAQAATFERPASDARDRALAFEATAIAAAGLAVVMGGVGTWLLVRERKQPVKLSVTGFAARVGW